MSDAKASTSLNPDTHVVQKELDEISCPICMEYPHNAVLLLCSSHEKGCRSYICDTSYRHSNCLDRFKKLKADHPSNHHHSQPISSVHEHTESFSPRILGTVTSGPFSGSPRIRRNSVENTQGLSETSDRHNGSLGQMHLEGHIGESVNVEEVHGRDMREPHHLMCPLCRGTVTGWKTVKEARQYLDMKPRSCSRESCSFSGNYGELRRHARRVHPMTRPADVDPSRHRAWRHLEHQREYGDILSAIRSAMPGAVMFGDYVIDNDDDSHDHELGSDMAPWWATLFLFHMMSGLRDEPGSSSRASRVCRRSSLNRYLWGENLLGLRYDQDDDGGDEIFMPRRRRRYTRSRPDEERP